MQNTKKPFYLEYLKELIIIFLVGIIYIYRKFKTREINPETSGLKAAKGKKDIQAIARELSILFGFSYSVFDPRRWFEQDKEIYQILKTLSSSEVNEVGLVYFKVYAKGRDLKSDIVKYLDSEYLHKLTNI